MDLEQAVRKGHTLMLIHVGEDEAVQWREVLERHQPTTIHSLDNV